MQQETAEPIRPLLGLVVGVTAQRRHEEQVALLEVAGARVVHAPMLRTAPTTEADGLRHAIGAVLHSTPDAVVVASADGVAGLFRTAADMGVSEQLRAALAGARILARGPKTAAALDAEGLPSAWQGRDATSTELLAEVRRLAPAARRVAVVPDGRCEPELARDVAATGAEVVPLPTYRWELPTDRRPGLALVHAVVEGCVDAVTFTSSPAVWNTVALARSAGVEEELRASFADTVRAVCIGPVCSAAATGAGLGWVLQPARPVLAAMVHTLADAVGRDRAVVQVGAVAVLVDATDAVVDGTTVALGPRERALLERLLVRPGAVVSKVELRASAWDTPVGLHAVEVAVGRLRERLGGLLAVHNVPRRGYRLAPPG